ncbi:MAG TPA: four helix bundle protein [Candidatus Marinimicrobia bacterium]|nr:four helix bundle protein [Candidatus Neomarinimicrobiota bacterium]HRS51656.1 four helix bundle protein [Candidatus Neomarinimicrobiota bacterium]HRU92194.1 four helix bundle protein [Candidatus Neomarinimicrobiota bacterium]
MKLEELNIYNLAMELGEEIWTIVKCWNSFEKDTMGKQLIRAVDSIAANLAEGFGRYHFKDVKNFGYYSRGSLYETKIWLTKAHNRTILGDDDFKKLQQKINDIGVKLNNYIKSIGKSTNSSISNLSTTNHNE